MAVSNVKEVIKPEPQFINLLDLASERLGGKVLYATDDFFAEKENLIMPGRGIFIPDKYTDRGKWMDGWESRRKRTVGHDWAVMRLGAPGIIKGVDIDTNYFLGNHPPHALLQAVYLPGDAGIHNWDEVEWKPLLPKSHLDAGSHNYFDINSDDIISHVRLDIFPDGGVARCKIYGHVYKSWDHVDNDELIDLAAAVNGGKSIACNDMFFSSMDNLLMPGRGVNMGDGWETKRNRTPGNRDWVIVKLATRGVIKKILVDTCHFKGNYPDSCSVEACVSNNDEDVMNGNVEWIPVLPLQKLSADAEHIFDSATIETTATHIRMNIFPDGGISRLRVLGNKV